MKYGKSGKHNSGGSKRGAVNQTGGNFSPVTAKAKRGLDRITKSKKG
jgi:hypothetical protein